MDTFEKVQALNEYNESVGYYEDIIYSFDEDTVNKVFPNAFEALRASHFGDVDFADDYFIFNRYGNIETLSNWKIDELYNEIIEVYK